MRNVVWASLANGSISNIRQSVITVAGVEQVGFELDSEDLETMFGCVYTLQNDTGAKSLTRSLYFRVNGTKKFRRKANKMRRIAANAELVE